MYEVRVGQFVTDKAHERYGEQRSASGRPSEFDFVAGALAAAVLEFRSSMNYCPPPLGPTARDALSTT